MAVSFANVNGTDYSGLSQQTTTSLAITKPSADATGTILDISHALHSLTAGTFNADIGGTPLTLNVITGPTNAPSGFRAGSQWCAGDSSHGTPINCGSTNTANAQRSAVICVLSGCNLVTPVRASGVATGTSTAPQAPSVATTAQPGDLVMRKVFYHDDGDELSVTRPGGLHTAGPLQRPAAADGKAIVIDFYVVGTAAAPAAATYAIPSSRAWVAETIIYATSSTPAMQRPQSGIVEGGMSNLTGGMQGRAYGRSRIFVPPNFHAFGNRRGIPQSLRF